MICANRWPCSARVRLGGWSFAPLLAALLASCATQPGDKAAQQAPEGDGGKASQLYAGEPSIVHSTEYPITSAEDGIRRGDLAYREGKLDLAIYLYVQSLSFDATRPEAFVKIGAVHEQKGNAALAEKAYELALEREPDNAAVCERLGLMYLKSGRDAEAPALFERAVTIDPKRWRSYNGLGVLADRRGDFTAAIGYYNKALAIDPAAAMVMNNRGYSRFLAGDLPGAEADLQTAIRLGAKGSVWTNLGRVQAMQGRYAEGLESLLQDKDLAHAYNLLGEAAMERGDFDSGKRYFESAISESPRYFEAAQKNLGLAKERLLAAPANGATKVVVADTPVYSDGAVVGLVAEGEQVQVLRIQQNSSLVRFRNNNGAEHTGWMPSASLAERP
jgi:Flp pilus assembly protein TadD